MPTLAAFVMTLIVAFHMLSWVSFCGGKVFGN